jgi:hypothetical protein
MKPKLVVSLVAGLLAATAAQACPACGDKLSLVGGGVSFMDAGRAGPPGRVVLYAGPGSPLQSAEADLGLVSRMKRAGHEVTVVSDSAELDRVVREHGADVVIAHWSEANATNGRIAKESTSPPTVVAVSYKADDAKAAMAAGVGDCLCKAEQHKGRELTATVDKVLELRRKGQSADCPVKVASRTN